jgi:hypothetical protein
MSRRVGIAFLLLVASVHAQTSSRRANAPRPLDNPELTQLYNEDQRVREPKPLGPGEPKITRTDADRLALVKQMIAHDQLQTAADYRHAAFIAQHSPVSWDYLLAHTLAVICAAEGDKSCLWLAAATLDRYLQSIQQPQIYGTQFKWTADSPVTQQPYTPDLITDAMRKKLGVPALADQQKQFDELKAHTTAPPYAPQSAPVPQSPSASPK